LGRRTLFFLSYEFLADISFFSRPPQKVLSQEVDGCNDWFFVEESRIPVTSPLLVPFAVATSFSSALPMPLRGTPVMAGLQRTHPSFSVSSRTFPCVVFKSNSREAPYLELEEPVSVHGISLLATAPPHSGQCACSAPRSFWSSADWFFSWCLYLFPRFFSSLLFL